MQSISSRLNWRDLCHCVQLPDSKSWICFLPFDNLDTSANFDTLDIFDKLDNFSLFYNFDTVDNSKAVNNYENWILDNFNLFEIGGNSDDALGSQMLWDFKN